MTSRPPEYAQRIPSVWRGAVADFGILHWSMPYVRETFGGFVCHVSASGRPLTGGRASELRDYLNRPEPADYTFTRVDIAPGDTVSEPMLAELALPNRFIGREEIRRYAFYAGAAGLGALPHRHGDALNLLVRGRKRWVLFDAAEGTPGRALHEHFRRTYPGGTTVTPAQWHEGERGALGRLAALPGGTVYEFQQEAGDVVYAPRDFAHAVVNETEVLGLTLEADLSA